MKTFSTIAVGAVAVTLLAAAPASAQHYRDNDRNDRGRNAVLGAVVGGLAGAALGVGASNRGSDCEYYRGGRCYRNQGHWERDHNINSNNGYNRREARRFDREQRREQRRDHRQDRRDYRYDRRW